MGASTSPPPKAGRASPPRSNALSTLWCKMVPKRSRYIRLSEALSASARESQMVSG